MEKKTFVFKCINCKKETVGSLAARVEMRSSELSNTVNAKFQKSKPTWTQRRKTQYWKKMELKSCKKKKRKRGGKVQRGGRCKAEGCCSMLRSPRSKNCWSLVLLSACPSSFKTNEEPRHAVGEETEETARRGFYLLRLTGRLSLFLRRQVLRWCCAYPRLAITALLTSGGLWKPFPLNLAPFWREMETRRRLREKDQGCDPNRFVCGLVFVVALCLNMSKTTTQK